MVRETQSKEKGDGEHWRDGGLEGRSQKIPPLPSLNTLVFDHEALKQSGSCGGSMTAVKKGPSFQEGVSGGFRKAILQTPQGIQLFRGDPGPRERESSPQEHRGLPGASIRATLPMDAEKWKLWLVPFPTTLLRHNIIHLGPS